MKKKSLLPMGTALLISSLVIVGTGANTHILAQAEESSAAEEGFTSESEDNAQQSDETDSIPENLEEQFISETGASDSVAESKEKPEYEEKTENKKEESTLTSVHLNLDQGLETVPAVFLDYLKDLDIYSVTLVYSDGTQRQLGKEEEGCTVSVEQEDETDTEGAIHRTYHAIVKETSTGREFEDTQEIVFEENPSSEIKADEMTTLALEGRKWLILQSTPEVTGRYALNSDKTIKNIYYVSEEGEVNSTENELNLQAGITYQLLVILE